MEEFRTHQKAQKVQNTEDYLTILSKGQKPELHTFEHHTELARRRGEREIQIADGNIKSEYKKRLKSTKELRAKLQHHLQFLNAELEAFSAARDELLNMMVQVQRPLMLTQQWLHVRAEEGSFGDPIEGSLQQSVYEGKSSVATLAELLGEAQIVMGLLTTTKQRYEKEIEAKEMIILLDKASMDDALSGAIAMDVIKTIPVQRALMQTHALHTEDEWKMGTAASISSGTAVVERAKAARKNILNALRLINKAGRLQRPLCVVDALQQRIRENSFQCHLLDLNMKMIQGEMLTLEKQKAMLNGSLEKVRQQLETARQRLSVRVVKPPQEVQQAGVEETLEVEVIRMKNTEASLLKQLKELETKMKRLNMLVGEIRKELGEKSVALNLDKKCASMPLPPIESSSPRQRSPSGSDRSSARSSRSARIEKPMIPAPPKPIQSTVEVPKIPKKPVPLPPTKSTISPRK
jgi:hypothetical protein